MDSTHNARIQIISSGVLATIFSHQCISQKAVRISHEKQFGCNCDGESVPDFLRLPLATCHFRGGQPLSPPPTTRSGPANVHFSVHRR